MKSLYIKIALVGIIGVMHSASMCMLQPKADKYQKRMAKKTAETMELLKKSHPKEGFPLALPCQRPAMEGNFFTELPKETRAMCVPSTKPNRDVPFQTRQFDLCRENMWLSSKINVSSTSRASRFVMLRDNPDLAAYIRRKNGVRLYPNPTAAISVSFERGLQDKAGLRYWNPQAGYERSYTDSIKTNELMERVRYNQANPPLIKCSIQ